ncbi:Hypothetical predicted protein [Olea europaea subsp. europaea]|uniref:Uncharacterized protein n=1 Tax=Olea europaea subsp. europaea TaxID=158383 RepID=A0A8S0QBV0_OLEEU|nr:Hypothetical predicted protein [Olea europaea subsp. europaea]
MPKLELEFKSEPLARFTAFSSLDPVHRWHCAGYQSQCRTLQENTRAICGLAIASLGTSLARKENARRFPSAGAISRGIRWPRVCCLQESCTLPTHVVHAARSVLPAKRQQKRKSVLSFVVSNLKLTSNVTVVDKTGQING